MNSGHKDLCSGIFFLLFAGFLYAQSFAITMSTADALGPQFFPRLVVVFMVILSVVVIVKAVGTIKKERTVSSDKDNTAKKEIPWNIPLLLTVGLLIAYFLLIKSVGYVVLTAAYLFCQMFILLPHGSIKNAKYIAIVTATSILIPVGIYLLFYKVFMIFLPAGILG